MRSIYLFIKQTYLDLFFSGLEIMMIVFGMRSIDYAVQEYNQVRRMGLIQGYIQMLINNEEFY